jgi:nucleoside-diphosphate-sugar epimerase
MARYLVTGCAGFVASHLVDALLGEGHEVVGVDAFTDYYPREVKERNLLMAKSDERFRLVEADLTNCDVRSLLVDADGVFHLAAQPGVRGSWGSTFEIYDRHNILVTQRVLEAAADAGLRVVLASSSSIYGDAEAYPTREDAPANPISPYGVTKWCCEQLARTYARTRDLHVVTLRYFTVYGPRQRPDMAFAKLLRSLSDGSRFTLLGTGEQSRDVTYVGDAVAATVLAMTNGTPGATYNVGGGSETALNDVIGILEALSGNTLSIDRQPAALGDVRRTAADIARANAELGWHPEVDIRDGLVAQLASTRPDMRSMTR